MVCAMIVAGFSSVMAGGEGWVRDFELAKAEAAKSNKDLLLDFSGSDWCVGCIKLNKEVFSEAEFNEGVKDRFVLVELDFPHKTKLPEAEAAQNEALRAKFRVNGFPTIILCDAKGRPYAKTGYQKDGPGPYVVMLSELRSRRVKRDELFAAAEKMTGVEKAKTLVSALDAIQLPPPIVDVFYSDVVESIKQADPKDESGYVKKAEKASLLMKFQQDLQGFMQKKDFDGALGLMDNVMKEDGLDPLEAQRMVMTKAMIYAQQGNKEDALKAVDQAIEWAPESPVIDKIKAARKQIEDAKP
jgi:thiol-disulfide isomerase/thioredoxin